MSPHPPWLIEAEKYLGMEEIPGVRHEGRILRFWQALKMGGVKDDETPWCAAFVGAMLVASGIAAPHRNPGLARSYLNWGTELAYPIMGCVVVLSRAGGGGHVFFADSVDERGRIGGIGGNQGNKVSHAFFERSRVLGYRWPLSISVPQAQVLPVIISAAASSSNEA